MTRRSQRPRAAGRPSGSGRGLVVTGTVRMTPTEAEQLRARYGTLTRAIRRALDLQRRVDRAHYADPPRQARINPPPATSPSPTTPNPTDEDS